MLSHFPRPPKDNRRGVHGPTSQYPDGLKKDWAFWEQEFKELHLSWFKMIDPGDASAIWLAERLISIGIMPVVRFYRQEPNPDTITGQEVEAARRYVSIGAVYFETNNEPDLALEWKGGKRPENWLDIVVRNFIAEADMIRSAGGFLLFPAFGPGGRGNPFQMIVDYGRKDLLDGNCCLAIHNYCLGRPLDYPNDSVTLLGEPITKEEWRAEAADKKQGGPMWAWEMGYETVNEHRRNLANSDANIMDDSTCFRAFEYFDALVNQACGHSVPIFTTEGGYSIGQRAGTTFGDDPRWPKPSPKRVAEMTVEMFKQIEQGPDYYFACMPWYLAGQVIGEGKPYFESQGPWYSFAFNNDFYGCDDPHGRMPVVFALKDYPGQVRTNGPLSEHWGESGTEPQEIKMPNEFSEQIEIYLKSNRIINDAEVYGVAIESADVSPGQEFYQCIGIHHLAPEENNGRHHLYLEVLNESGARLRQARIGWEWAGMRPDEKPGPVIIDKPPLETSNIVLQGNFAEVHVWVEGLPSDKVTGLRSTHPDEDPGNTWGHHSFLVVWQRTEMPDETPEPEPEPEPEPTPEPNLDGYIRKDVVTRFIGDLEATLGQLKEELG